MMAKRRARQFCAARPYRAGISLRRERSPEAPKMTMVQGSAGETEDRRTGASASMMFVLVGDIAPSLALRDLHAIRDQIGTQLRGILKTNRGHAQLPRAFQVQLAIVNKEALFRAALRHFERQLIDAFVGLADSQIAGAEKSLELAPQIEFMDSELVEFARLVVDRREQILPCPRNLVEHGARGGQFRGLPKDEIDEFLAGEISFAVEDRALQVGVEGDLARLEGGTGEFVAILELFPIEIELFGGGLARGAVPTVGQDDTAHVPEQSRYIRHRAPSEPLV